MLEPIESSRDVSVLDLSYHLRVEAEGAVEGDDIARLAAADNAGARDACNVHDTWDGRTVNAMSRGTSERHHASAT